MRADSRALHRAGLVLAVVAAFSVTGCGVTSAVGNAVDPAAEAATVSRAATRTGELDGFRFRATLTTAANGVGAQIHMVGTMDTRNGIEAETERLHAGRRLFSLQALFRGGMTYLNLSSVPGLKHQLGSRPWVTYDLYRAEGLPDPSVHYNPAEFVDFLRWPGMQVKELASQAVAGVPATLYRADVNLDKYARSAPPRLRASTWRTVHVVEATVHSHVLPEDVWVDGSGMIRQVSWGYTECVAGTSVSTGMLIDFFGFGPQASAKLPPPAHTRNYTRQLTAQFSTALREAQRMRISCGSPA